MPIPTYSGDTNVIQQLADRPNDTNGLSAAALKAKFDEATGDLKTFINGTLIPFLQSSSAAGALGVDDSILSMGVSDVQEALEALQAAITQSALPPGGIKRGDIADGEVVASKLGSDVDYAAIGLAEAQVMPIYVQNTVPEGTDPDGVYLVTA